MTEAFYLQRKCLKKADLNYLIVFVMRKNGCCELQHLFANMQAVLSDYYLYDISMLYIVKDMSE